MLANVAKKFQSEIRIQRGDDQANAKSLVTIMGLDIGQGDKVNLVAQGRGRRTRPSPRWRR